MPANNPLITSDLLPNAAVTAQSLNRSLAGWFGAAIVRFDDEGALVEPGQPEIPAVPAREAGDRYGFRADEVLLFLARGFDARLAALEGAHS